MNEQKNEQLASGVFEELVLAHGMGLDELARRVSELDPSFGEEDARERLKNGAPQNEAAHVGSDFLQALRDVLGLSKREHVRFLTAYYTGRDIGEDPFRKPS